MTVLIGFATILPETTQAQYIKRLAKDSAVNATTRYLTFTSTPDLVKSFALTAIVSTGSLSITSSVLEARIDTIGGATDWIAVPSSLVVVDSSLSGTVKNYQYHVLYHSANGYRIKVTSAGTQKTYLYASYLRRTQ